jgi:hypothetical protein
LKVIDKIAFLVHEPTMYAHYVNVWKEIPCSKFLIVLLSRSIFEGGGAVLGAKDFMSNIRTCGYDYCYFDDIVRKGIKFKYVVTNHKIGGSSRKPATKSQRLMESIKNTIKRALNTLFELGKIHWYYPPSRIDKIQYFPLQIGQYQVRFMYGADVGDGWSLQDWNEMYDIFLCHGPNDEEELAKKFKGKTAIMGYPRYDGYFSGDLNVVSITTEFNLDPGKKTLLWMSTLGENASSIPYYAECISKLFSEYNVIARPHPIAFRQEPQNIELLQSFGFKIDTNVIRDMNLLYKAVDWVLCDYGGSSFGAIYLDINLMLLDVPGSESEFTVVNSSNLELRKSIPSVKINNKNDIKVLLENEDLCAAQEKCRAAMFERYFANLRGRSSKEAARILLDLDSIITSSLLQ